MYRRGLVVGLGLLLVAGVGDAALCQQDDALTLSLAHLVPTGLYRLVPWDDLRAVRTFFERVDVNSTAAGISPPAAAEATGIARLARRLSSSGSDPFEFVRRRIAYLPYPGSVRGPQGTLEASAGNSLDQSLLLQALLTRQGVRARLVRGRLGWNDAAALVLGSARVPAAGAGDPWPRWLEIAADHWWVEADREGEWVALDPAFKDAEAGVARGRRERTFEALPAELEARLEIELSHRGHTIKATEVPTAELVGSEVDVALVPMPASTVRARSGGESESAHRSRLTADLVPVPWAQAPVPSDFLGEQLIVVPQEPMEETGPWMAQVRMPGRTFEAGPFEETDLAGLLLRVTLKLPDSPEQVLEVAWGSRHGGVLSLVIGAGDVSDSKLAATTSPLYEALSKLAAAELAARDAMRPPLNYWSATTTLRQAATEAWDSFNVHAPSALAWAILRAIDRLPAHIRRGRVLRPGVRLAAVRWQPPDAAGGGALTVKFSDPVVIGEFGEGVRAAALQAAYGLLQSAVVSQILNRLAEEAPDTAFDVTLRAVGTGRGLGWWTGPGGLPESWSATARAATRMALADGFAIVAPAASTGMDGESVVGWWEIGPVDGSSRGWVLTSLGAA
ncbi:MAG: transglutaminase domain-containing protein, partial [Acidobacteriota bacterium]